MMKFDHNLKAVIYVELVLDPSWKWTKYLV